MKILNFGSCNIDYVYTLEHIIFPGETLSTKSLEIFPGGKGLNQSIAVARAGVPVWHAGYIGSDGNMLQDILQESGADISFLKQIDSPNGHAIIQLDPSGENSIFVYQGTNGCIGRDYMDQVLSHFSSGDLLLLHNEINDIDYLIQKAHTKGMQIVLNPSPFTKDLNKLDLNKITYLLLNETEAKGFSGTEDPQQFISFVRKHYPRLKVVLTLGKQGCIYADNLVAVSHPAFEVNAVDTTAAGDTFTGYFVAQVAKGSSYTEAIRTATAASAVAVSKMGAAPSIPTKEQVELALKTLRVCVPAGSKWERQERQILEYLKNNLIHANLQGLSFQMGYSEVYVGTFVRDVTGKSFSELLQHLRCETAAKLLRETDLPISEIISRIGYQNESFFRAKFKKQYGMTPNHYRKNRGNI